MANALPIAGEPDADDMPTKAVTKKAKPKHKMAPVGSGARFAALRAELAKKGARNPDALAAAIGRKKLGNRRFAQIAARGR